MNWYKRIILAQGVNQYLRNLGANDDIIQYILSQGNNTQFLVNEFKKNPGLTIEHLQTFNFPQKNIEIPYTYHETRVANSYPEPIKTWILVNLRKIRVQKDTSSESERDGLHNNYMYFIDLLPQILDWFQFTQPTPDISSYTPAQAIKAQKEWHEMMAGQGEGKNYSPAKPEMIVYGPQWQSSEWKDWTIQKVEGKNNLLAEGNKMNNCVGEYCENVEKGTSVIYSLRDPQNNPHVTIEVAGLKETEPHRYGEII